MKPHLTFNKVSFIFILAFSNLILAADPAHIEILGNAIMNCLDSDLSHTNPALARQNFLQGPLEEIGILGNPLANRFTMLGEGVGLRDVPRIANRRAGDAWYHLHTDTVDVPGGIIYRNENSLGNRTRWLLERSDMNVTIEELTHMWENNVGIERALEETPKYRRYLQATGQPFDSEAYVDALMEQKGRRLAGFESSRYPERPAYREWLKQNGGMNKIKITGKDPTRPTSANNRNIGSRKPCGGGGRVQAGLATGIFAGLTLLIYGPEETMNQLEDMTLQKMQDADIFSGKNPEHEALPLWQQFLNELGIAGQYMY